MLVGDRENFGIEIHLRSAVGNRWIYGTYVLWANGMPIGDPNDHAVDLRGCCNWMQNLTERPPDRYEPGLYEMDRTVAYVRLASSALANPSSNRFAKEAYADTVSRFHISHIGMSSFDRVTLLWLKNLSGSDRLIWQVGEDSIQDAHVRAGLMETAFREAIRWMRQEMPPA